MNEATELRIETQPTIYHILTITLSDEVLCTRTLTCILQAQDTQFTTHPNHRGTSGCYLNLILSMTVTIQHDPVTALDSKS